MRLARKWLLKNADIRVQRHPGPSQPSPSTMARILGVRPCPRLKPPNTNPLQISVSVSIPIYVLWLVVCTAGEGLVNGQASCSPCPEATTNLVPGSTGCRERQQKCLALLGPGARWQCICVGRLMPRLCAVHAWFHFCDWLYHDATIIVFANSRRAASTTVVLRSLADENGAPSLGLLLLTTNPS